MTEICALAWLCHPLLLLSRTGALLTAVVPRTEGILPLQIKELVSAGKLFAMVRLDMNRFSATGHVQRSSFDPC
jgi:hypothetical protein